MGSDPDKLTARSDAGQPPSAAEDCAQVTAEHWARQAAQAPRTIPLWRRLIGVGQRRKQSR
ncbi:MAG: hypothetical protein PsegKO_13950 [Pseudohongiellaceae bacterium]